MTNIFFLCGIVVVFISISFEQFFSFLCVYCEKSVILKIIFLMQ